MSATATDTIPEDPAAGALALLMQAIPTAKAELTARVQSIDAELAQQVEAARLDPKVPLARFLADVGRKARLRATLASRLEQMDPSLVASPTPTAATVHATIRSVRRWRSGGELRAMRPGLIDLARAELDQVVAEIRGLTDRAGSQLVVAPEGSRAGLAHQHDEWLRRAESLLTRRQAAAARLTRLDPTGDAGRSAAVKAAIDKAGGASVVAESIRPTSPAAAELAKAQKAVDTLADQVERIDPETEKASRLDAELVKAKERLQMASEASAAAIASTAGQIVQRALAGSLGGIGELQSYLAPSSELAKALDAIRGADADCIAVVEALMC